MPEINSNIYTLLFNENGILERFMAHEFEHATQPGIIESLMDYARRKNEIYSESVPPIPVEDYQNRIKTASQDDERMQAIFGEIYDNHLAPVAATLTETIISRFSSDTVIQDFVNKYEASAIEFENSIMTKYFNEPARTTDYTRSGDFEEYLKAGMDRQAFVDSALAAFRFHTPKENVKSFSPDL